GSSTETPTTASPCGPYFDWNSLNQGISTLHGGHHVAQKSRRITLPFCAARLKSLPFTSFKVKLRFAGLGLASHSVASAALIEYGSGAKIAISTGIASTPNHRKSLVIN